MNAVIIFDLNDISNNHAVIQNMMNRGYLTKWVKQQGDADKYYLPSNMVWKPNTELDAAKVDLDSVIEILNLQPHLPPNQRTSISLSRCIVLSSTPWIGIPGIPVVEI
jgi:hypothetical protein